MAYANKTIRNPHTGQDIRFLQTSRDTGGKLLEMETTYSAFSKEPAPHYHPYQEEDFTILTGEVHVRINGQVKVLNKGEKLHIPPNTIHSMWNKTDSKTVVNWKVRPAMNTEYLLETANGLGAEGKVNKKGMPPLLQVALIANRFSKEFRLHKPPFVLQKIVFGVLTPFAYLAGFRPTYKRFLD